MVLIENKINWNVSTVKQHDNTMTTPGQHHDQSPIGQDL